MTTVGLFCAWAAIATVTVVSARAMVRGRFPWLVAAVAFVVVGASAAAVVYRWAFAHPYWDQWVEGKGLYQPFVEGSLRWSQLFAAHNEHRIALARLWSLLVFALDGHVWNNRLIAGANVVLHATGAGLLAGALATRFPRRDALAGAATLILGWALPLARDNLLLGFQSQFYFMLIYAPMALRLLVFCEPRTTRFWIGAVAAVLALFSVGSGPLVGAALLGLWLLERGPRDRLPLVAVAAAVTVAGALLRVSPAYLEAAHAHTVGELLRLALRCWSFPFTESYVMGGALWAPWLIWLSRRVLRGGAWADDERFLCALGLFVFVHAPLIGWARANDSSISQNRYFDIFTLGLVVNALAVARTPFKTAVIAWCLVAATGLGLRARRMFVEELPYVERAWREQERHLYGYLATGDAKQLVAPVPWEIPHWSAAELQQLLDDPFIRSILPARPR